VGRWLTCDDNMAYVPQFQLAVARTAEWMRSERAEPSPFAGLSPETSHRQLLDRIGNLCGERHLRKHPEDAGRVLVAELPAEELVAILDRLVTVLGPDQSRS
jgi:hypothetical protein